MIVTICLAAIMMAGLFLMLWSAVGFIQDTRSFGSAPKAVLDTIQPKSPRFKGQHTVGWLMMIFAIVLMGGAVILGAYDGIQNSFGFLHFFMRFVVMLILLKTFDILFFDWVLLCNSNFYPHYYPEVKNVLGPLLFGFNKKSHLIQIVLMLAGSFILAWICTLFV